jgi:signal transduction histidine kinase
MIELLTELENAIRVTYRQKNVAFSVSVNDALPPLVVGDRNRLQQLLNNLLTNAFKFTDEGSVGLLVSVIAQGIDKVTLRFDVRDTGIGMSPEFVSRAFEPYAREESHTGYRQGFGLGLPICRQLVELMGGTIGISSVPGRGSCFTVTLPFDLPQLPS